MSLLKSLFLENQEQNLNKGLETTRKSFFSKLGTAIVGKSTIDTELLDDLEEVLVRADVGVATTLKIIRAIETRIAKEKYLGVKELKIVLQEEIATILTPQYKNTPFSFSDKNEHSPHVIMVVGVNGVGKTTTIGKLAYHYKAAGKKVVLGASDTFRAGAIDQLQVWANRSDIPLVKQQMGSDPASVAFDTLESAVKQKADIVLIDTAGRLHNKVNLMNELSKIRRVMSRSVAESPHEVLLVLDGSTGQNAFEQAKQFTEQANVTGLVITKIDGTAKGGVVLGISDAFQLPVKFIGIGEGVDDLQTFNMNNFLHSFFN